MNQKINTLVTNNRRFIPLIVTGLLAVVAYAVGAVFYDGMRDPQIIINLFRSSPFLLISAIGMTLVIITGGIDLSVSGVIALTTTAAAALLRAGWNPWVVILTMLVMGMIFGAIMGGFITYLKVQPFIATLAGTWIAQGLCFFISDDAIAIHDRTFQILGQTKILIPGLSDPTTHQGAFISILMIVAAVVLVATILIAHYTPFGRTIYAIGGSEQSARLMGLPVNRTKVLVYTFNGFCSALAGIVMAIYVMSGHGLYAKGLELVVIASVVMGGTSLSGGVGYVFGTQIGVLVTGVTQTLIQFNGQLSSWWTNIVVGALTLIFIGVQSVFASRKGRQAEVDTSWRGRLAALWATIRQNRSMVVAGGVVLALLLAIGIGLSTLSEAGSQTGQDGGVACTLQPQRPEQLATLMKDGALIAYERNGGPRCIDEIFAIYPDGRVVGDNGTDTIEAQVSATDLDALLKGIADKGWFTDEFYDTYHTPCGQCFVYTISMFYKGDQKTVKAVDGGTDAPSAYWEVVSLINGVIPKFPTGQ